MTRRLDWQDYRTTEFAGLDPARVIAVLPTAAVEQHGPHLPVGVDTFIMAGMLDALRRVCPDDLDLRILPIQAVGKSNEHIHAPGTLTLPAEVALKAWVEIGLSVARAGLRVPEDLSLAAVATDTRHALGLNIAQSVMPSREIGRAGCEMLHEKIDTPGRKTPARCIPMPWRDGPTVGPPPSST